MPERNLDPAWPIYLVAATALTVLSIARDEPRAWTQTSQRQCVNMTTRRHRERAY
jgi:hypothetical protein